jgi:hypothetical protein
MSPRPSRTSGRLYLLDALEPRLLLSSTLIPSFNNDDIIPDPVRNRVYFTHNTTSVDRYDLTTGAFLTPWTLSSPAFAGDITVSGDTLYLTDPSSPILHKIDLATDTVTDISMPEKVFSLITLPDNTLLFNYTYNPDPFGVYRFNPATNTITTAANPGHGLLLGDATHHYAAATLGGSPNQVHIFKDGALVNSFGLGNVFGVQPNVSVSRDGSQVAVAHGYSVETFAIATGEHLATYQGSGAYFDSNRDILYTFYDSILRIYQGNTTYSLSLGESYYATGAAPAGAPRNLGFLQPSLDGSTLFINTLSGVRALALPAHFYQPVISTVTTAQPLIQGKPATFSVTVAGGPDAGSLTPTGAVTFVWDNGGFSTVPLLNGAATLTMDAVPAGGVYIRAAFQGDENFVSMYGSSTYYPASQLTPTVTAHLSSTQTAVGQSITISGTITSADGANFAGQLLWFDADPQFFGNLPATAINPDNTFSATLLPAFGGPFLLTASYHGSTTYTFANAQPLSLTVTKAQPTLTLSYTAANKSINYTAAGGAGLLPADGAFSLYEGDTLLGNTASSSSGGFGLPQNTAGIHTYRIVYAGNGTYASASATLTVNVQDPTTTAFSFTASTMALKVGDTFTLTAVAPADLNGIPKGTVYFYRDGVIIAAVPLVNGAASFSLTATADQHLFHADYVPTSNHTFFGMSDLRIAAYQPTVVDLLVLYTPTTFSAAGQSLANLLPFVYRQIDNANKAFANSQVPLSLRLAALSFVNYQETTFSQDLDRLQTPNDGYLDAVPGLRNVVGADLVILVRATTEPQPLSLLVTSGIASRLLNFSAPTRDDVNAAVIAFNAPQADYLLAHEVAHTFGATHAPGDSPANTLAAPYGQGYRFTGNDGITYRDIMAYDPGKQLPYFSSPNITYAGKPLGDPATADVARLLREQAPTVAAYRAPGLLGGIDAVNSNTLQGWFYQAGAYNTPLTVTVTIDGVARDTFVANATRYDLLPAFGVTDNGFTYTLPKLSAGRHTVTLTVRDPFTGASVQGASETVTATDPLFDEAFYLARYPDIAAAVKAGRFPTGYDHFLRAGQFEGRDSSPWFDTAWYLAHNADLAAARTAGNLPSPFAHYVAAGQFESRSASPYYDERFYRLANPDVASAIAKGLLKNGLGHFLLFGQYEGRTALPYFDPAWYKASNPAVSAAAMRSPIAHFLATGNAAGASPGPYFNGATYLAKNPSAAAAVSAKQFISGLDHYLRQGRAQGLAFSNTFSESSYLAHNPDIAAAVRAGIFSSGFEHWLLAGRFESRQL